MIDAWVDWVRCPSCHGRLIWGEASLTCTQCAACYPIAHSGAPILLRHGHPLFPTSAYTKHERPASVEKSGYLRRLVPQISVNLAGMRILKRLEQELQPEAAILVVGGGRQRKALGAVLSSEKFVTIYSDIDIEADVDLFSDAHELPFANEIFDAVITTAVLEHVMYPEQVIAEIVRVLRPGGRIYSELPFMQQVHEGAYDFTRYTLSGHRRLLNHFEELESGMIAGPGTALAWAIEYFLTAFADRPLSRQLLKASSRFATFWLKWFDYYLAKKPQAMDGASCTYFYGSKSSSNIADELIIARYVGGNSLSHI